MKLLRRILSRRRIVTPAPLAPSQPHKTQIFTTHSIHQTQHEEALLHVAYGVKLEFQKHVWRSTLTDVFLKFEFQNGF